MTDLSGIHHALLDAARGASFGQDKRLLRLHTPLGADVLLATQAHIQEHIGPQPNRPLCHMSVQAVSRSAHIDPDDLIGQPLRLELLTASGAIGWRPFHGHVLAMRLTHSDGGWAHYTLSVGSWLDCLGWRTDAWVFQDMSAVEITEAVFADYMGQGRLLPAWRWALQDAAAYPRRSLCVQYNETDLAFLQRLWAEEGLFAWVEHSADGAAEQLGTHTLVLADHNGAFTPNAQARIRYTQAGAVLAEDSLTRWTARRSVGVSQLHSASWDYRQVRSHEAHQAIDAAHDQPMTLAHRDQPGAYAYDTTQDAERRTRIQLQSLDAARKQYAGRGTVRTLSPGTTFTLHGHDRVPDGTGFVALGTEHIARNNLSGDTAGNASDAPLYEVHVTAQCADVPYRAPLWHDSGRLAHPRPTATGTQTALVVGLDHPVHTDRDGRIKVQFHWQRGAASSHALTHPSPAEADNAPASDASGTWVRVAQAWAGANWGGVFIPRVGQEVVVAFIDGDIDRPVVLGAVYNGAGRANAQANDIAQGQAGATANAPAWFAGSARQGEHEGHAHGTTLSGIKTQGLDSSDTGLGEHNQLVFDDTPGQGRVLLHTTQQQTWLQMGHLLQQADNLRLAPRGWGLELHTQAQGAMRAGSGLHLSTHARAAGTTTAQGQPMDTHEARQQLQEHAGLLTTLAGHARTHRADLPNEPPAVQLPAHQSLQATLQSLSATQDQTAITERPDLVLSGPTAITALTPQSTVIATGQHITLTSQGHTQQLSQRHTAWAVKDGISFFTRGEVRDPQGAVADTGIRLHAASGNVNVQAQSGPFTLTAQQAIDIQSTAADIVLTAPERIVLNGSGGYVKIEGANIEIGTAGPAQFKAGMKVLTGGASASSSLSLKQAGPLKICEFKAAGAANGGDALVEL